MAQAQAQEEMGRTGAGGSVVGRLVAAIDDRCVCEADDGLSSHTDTGLPRRTELTAASNASSRGQARESRQGK